MTPIHRFLADSAADRATDRPRRSEVGDTLIEVLIALAVIGITAVALLTAFATSISASAVHRSLATEDTILKSFVETAVYQIQQQPNPLFQKCAVAATYNNGADAVTFNPPASDSAYSVTISSVSYWTGTSFVTGQSNCDPSSTAPQQIVATATNAQLSTSDSLTFVVADPGFVTPVGTATQLVVTTQPPATTAAGTSFTVQVAVEDALGNVVTSASGPVNLAFQNDGTNPGGGILTCAADPANAVSGVATFSCSVNAAGTGYALTASSIGLSSAITNAFNITAAAAQQLVITSAPVSGTAASAATLGPVTVQERDAFGNPTTTAETVTLSSITTGTASFSATSGGTGITTVAIPGGSSSATFYYGDTKAGMPTVVASATGLVSGTQTETISGGAATQLAFGPASPGPGTAGSSIPNLAVQVQDPYGNVATSASGSVTISINAGSPQAGFTSGTTTVGVSSGVATFSNLVVNTSGSYTFTATPVGISGVASAVNSNAFTVAAGPVTSFTVPTPASQTAGTAFNETITAHDAYGNVATGYTGSQAITFTGPSNSPNATAPTYPAMVTFASGVGTASIKLVDAQTTSLTATQVFATGTSGSFTVAPLAITHFLVGAPATATAGTAATGITLTAHDVYDNTATTYASGNHAITWSGPASSPAPAGLAPALPTSTVSFTNGVSTTSLSATLYFAGSNTLTATDSSSSGSATITVAPLAITHFLVGAPATATAGTAATGITLTAHDVYDNTATTYASGNHAITWSGAPNSPVGTAPVYPPTTVSFTNGVSTTALSATLYFAGSNTLTATDSLLNSGSATIAVSAGTASSAALLGSFNAYGTSTTSGLNNSGTSNEWIYLTDAYGNAATFGSPVTFNLTYTGTNTTWTPKPSSVVVSAGVSQATFTGGPTIAITWSGGSGQTATLKVVSASPSINVTFTLKD